MQSADIWSQIEDEWCKKLVQHQENQHMQLFRFISQQTGHANTDNRIKNRKHEFESDDIRKKLTQLLMIPCNAPVIEVCDPCIKQYIQQKGKIEKWEIKSIVTRTYHVLNSSVNPENPEWFNQKVQENDKGKIGNELPLHL